MIMGVMDSPPALRINPYQLCETPLVLAVIATASRHGVSGWVSASEMSANWSGRRHWRRLRMRGVNAGGFAGTTSHSDC